MALIIDTIDDYVISGVVTDFEQTYGEIPMLTAYVNECFLFSTELELIGTEIENEFCFEVVMGKKIGLTYSFWRKFPSSLMLTLNVKEHKATAFKEASASYKADDNFLKKLKDGWVVVQGGGLKRPMREDPTVMGAITNLAAEKSRIFKELTGLDLWLSHGNLLGLTREGRFLLHEKDIDMTYVSQQTTLDAYFDEFENIIDVLKKNGQRISFWRKDETLRFFPQWHDDTNAKLYFDVFPAWLDPKSGKFIGQKRTYFDCTAGEFFPLREVKVEEHEFLIPKCAEQYLEATYEANWKQVDNLYRRPGRTGEARKALKSIMMDRSRLERLHPKELDVGLTLFSD